MEASFMTYEKQRIKACFNEITYLETAKDHELVVRGRTKDLVKSEELKNEANKIFLQKSHNSKEHLKIWRLYSESIATAPTSSKELANVYYNRSSLLFHLKKYTECIDDLDKAVTCECTDILKIKLAFRKVECLMKLADPSMKDIISDTVNMMENLSLREEIKKGFLEKLNKHKYAFDETYKEDQLVLKEEISFDIDFQKEIPCASTALRIQFSDNFGKHLVSTRNINPGEILAVEEVYSLFLNFSSVYTHCSYCAKVAWASIPCEHCIYAMYCSEKCKNDAWNKYHDIECQIIDKMWNTDDANDSMIMFSIRLTIQAIKEFNGEIELLKKKLEEIDNSKDPCKNSFSEDGLHHSKKCQSILSLTTNSLKKTNNELLRTSRVSTIAVIWLEKCTKHFKKDITDSDILRNGLIHKEALFLGALISRMYHMLFTNHFDLVEERDLLPRRAWVIKNPLDEHHYSESLGSTIAPFNSLINHSCTPNVATCFSDKGEVILFSVNSITKGSQIFICYGELSYSKEKVFRQQTIMKSHLFMCDCIACKEDWPMYLEAPLLVELTNTKQLMRLMAQIDNLVCNPNFEEESFKKIVAETLHKLMEKSLLPCQEFYKLMDMLMHLHVILYGKWFQIPGICKK